MKAPAALRREAGLLLLLWLATLVSALLLRPIMPIDETRYVSVAWEMWLRGDFLVPHLNGEPYAHKPPLLFWLYQLGWWLFGVNEWWPRLVAPLFGLGALFLAFRLARALWPDRLEVARAAPWLLFGSIFWTGYGTTAMFDMLVVFFGLLGLLGLWQAGQGRNPGWLVTGAAIGLGLLAKGPVILLHLLPPALLAPLWSRTAAHHRLRWYAALGGALLLGIFIALAWAVPAALRGGEAYAHDIFWGQTADRVVDSFAHRRPLWWYLPLLPLIFYPWAWWGPVWRGTRRIRVGEPAVRFVATWGLPAFLGLSLISGKQVHYLLPLFPAAALLWARGLAEIRGPYRFRVPALVMGLFGLAAFSLPWWNLLPEWVSTLESEWALVLVAGAFLLWRLRPERQPAALHLLASASVLMVICLHLVMRQPLASAYDLRPVAREIARLQEQGVPLVHESKYAGEYHFLGRLREPLEVLYRGPLTEWARRHPDGYIILYLSRWERDLLPEGCHFWQFYRGQYVTLVPGHFYLDQILPSG